MTTDTLEALREAREALERQTENMAFVLNRVDLPEAWFANFNNELALSRTTLSRIDAALAESERDMTEQQPVAWLLEWRDEAQHPVNRRRAQLDQKLERWMKADDVRLTPLYASPDHIGKSTTMVPTLGVEGVAQIIRQHLNAPVSSCALLDIDEAARAIIAAMGKNDG